MPWIEIPEVHEKEIIRAYTTNSIINNLNILKAMYDNIFLTDGSRALKGSIIPDSDRMYDIGSENYRIKTIYCDNVDTLQPLKSNKLYLHSSGWKYFLPGDFLYGYIPDAELNFNVSSDDIIELKFHGSIYLSKATHADLQLHVNGEWKSSTIVYLPTVNCNFILNHLDYISNYNGAVNIKYFLYLYDKANTVMKFISSALHFTRS